jgi:predicted  nucleic acid-binding Zn-ribbon protein
MARGKKTVPKKKSKSTSRRSSNRKTKKVQKSKRLQPILSKSRTTKSKNNPKRKVAGSKTSLRRAKVAATSSARPRTRRSTKTASPRQRRGQQQQQQQQSPQQRLTVVRIMGQGQYQLDGETVNKLNEIDNSIVELIGESDEAQQDSASVQDQFREKMNQLVSLITNNGKEIDPEEIISSDFIIPPADSSIEEARSLFQGEGLIPG